MASQIPTELRVQELEAENLRLREMVTRLETKASKPPPAVRTPQHSAQRHNTDESRVSLRHLIEDGKFDVDVPMSFAADGSPGPAQEAHVALRSASERNALRALHSATDGTQWVHQWDLANENHCTWFGVQCSSSTNQVVSLALGENNLNGLLPSGLADLSALVSLDLHGNRLVGEIPPLPAGLQSLIMSDNQLIGPIPTSLGSFSSLLRLDISMNRLGGVVPSELGDLRILQVLDLSSCHLGGTLPNLFDGMSHLKVLNLQDNNFVGTLPSSLFTRTSLVSLRASWLPVVGTLPTQLGNLWQLVDLRMAGLQLVGTIPTTIGLLRALEVCALFDNQLTGALPTEIADMKSLRVLSVAGQHITALPPLLPDSIQAFSAYNNPISGTLPASLLSLPNLQVLSLGKCRLSGAVPATVAVPSPSLSQLFLSHNLFSGPLPAFSDFPALSIIYLNDNRIEGTLPTAWGGLSTLQVLDVSRNAISGAIPSQFGRMVSLTTLDASANSLVGTMPADLGQLVGLQRLVLSHNRLDGGLPATFASLINLQALDVSHNLLHARAEDFLEPLIASHINCRAASVALETRCTQPGLRDLRASHNHIAGALPSTLVELRQLVVLNLASNKLLGGTLPSIQASPERRRHGDSVYEGQGAPDWQIVNLSSTNLTGVIPATWAHLKSLRLLDIRSTAIRMSNISSFLQVSDVYQHIPKLNANCPLFAGINQATRLLSDPEFHSHELCACESRFYGLNGVCRLCPIGMDCTGPALRALPGYWADAALYHMTGELTVLRCPIGYCSEAPSPLGQHCAGHRDGILCGGCQPGYSLSFGSSRCLPSEDCIHGSILVIIIAAVTGLWVVWMVLSASGYRPGSRWHDSHGMWIISIYFYQMVPLTSTRISQLQAPLSVILDIANLQTNAAHMDSYAFCAFESSVSPFSRRLLFLVVPALMYFWVFCIWSWRELSEWRSETYTKRNSVSPSEPAGRTARQKRIGEKTKTFSALLETETNAFCICLAQLGELSSIFKPVTDGVIHTLLTITSFAYLPVLNCVLDLLRCMDVGDTKRLVFDGNVECFTPVQNALICIAIVLVALPYGLWHQLVAISKKYPSRRQYTEAAVFSSMCRHFRDRRQWWEAVLVARCMLVSLAYTATEQSLQWRGWCISVLHFVNLLVTVVMQPWECGWLLQFDLCTQCILVLLSMREIAVLDPFPSLVTLNADTMAVNPTFGWITSLSIAVPVICNVVFISFTLRGVYYQWVCELLVKYPDLREENIRVHKPGPCSHGPGTACENILARRKTLLKRRNAFVVPPKFTGWKPLFMRSERAKRVAFMSPSEQEARLAELKKVHCGPCKENLKKLEEAQNPPAPPPLKPPQGRRKRRLLAERQAQILAIQALKQSNWTPASPVIATAFGPLPQVGKLSDTSPPRTPPSPFDSTPGDQSPFPDPAPTPPSSSVPARKPITIDANAPPATSKFISPTSPASRELFSHSRLKERSVSWSPLPEVAMSVRVDSARTTSPSGQTSAMRWREAVQGTPATQQTRSASGPSGSTSTSSPSNPAAAWWNDLVQPGTPDTQPTRSSLSLLEGSTAPDKHSPPARGSSARSKKPSVTVSYTPLSEEAGSPSGQATRPRRASLQSTAVSSRSPGSPSHSAGWSSAGRRMSASSMTPRSPGHGPSSPHRRVSLQREALALPSPSHLVGSDKNLVDDSPRSQATQSLDICIESPGQPPTAVFANVNLSGAGVVDSGDSADEELSGPPIGLHSGNSTHTDFVLGDGEVLATAMGLRSGTSTVFGDEELLGPAIGLRSRTSSAADAAAVGGGLRSAPAAAPAPAPASPSAAAAAAAGAGAGAGAAVVAAPATVGGGAGIPDSSTSATSTVADPAPARGAEPLTMPRSPAPPRSPPPATTTRRPWTVDTAPPRPDAAVSLSLGIRTLTEGGVSFSLGAPARTEGGVSMSPGVPTPPPPRPPPELGGASLRPVSSRLLGSWGLAHADVPASAWSPLGPPSEPAPVRAERHPLGPTPADGEMSPRESVGLRPLPALADIWGDGDGVIP